MLPLAVPPPFTLTVNTKSVIPTSPSERFTLLILIVLPSSFSILPKPLSSIITAFVASLIKTLKSSLGSIAVSPLTCTIIVVLLVPSAIVPLPPIIGI